MQAGLHRTPVPDRCRETPKDASHSNAAVTQVSGNLLFSTVEVGDDLDPVSGWRSIRGPDLRDGNVAMH
jgi:hypothetical protein